MTSNYQIHVRYASMILVSLLRDSVFAVSRMPLEVFLTFWSMKNPQKAYRDRESIDTSFILAATNSGYLIILRAHAAV